MRLLLDTHVFLWWLAGLRSVSATAHAALNGSEAVHVSAASGYEIALKHAAGKLPGVGLVARDVAAAIRAAGFRELPITCAHAETAGRLPTVHRDPFDRLLAAQALVEELTLVSADAALDRFGIARLW
ncbi:type II toxin-antitoxin system VapC family toxin [Paracraurococcus lichenis]|uniref:Type II toxin-antitoxin system VapC family toxin n=1 Tax=Paracraurococcus lichenis TaxID=3064888 RepID=A0ABT9E3S6_9PROT|nr:type II toxin-antitoxin system VapC family toxin [Paracraurococcus sp. LOR1-02]MDO9710822.1 type II toxin-antitoxin system VapC family toxin [Paracraurococcus sp. LOR1-02]